MRSTVYTANGRGAPPTSPPTLFILPWNYNLPLPWGMRLRGGPHGRVAPRLTVVPAEGLCRVVRRSIPRGGGICFSYASRSQGREDLPAAASGPLPNSRAPGPNNPYHPLQMPCLPDGYTWFARALTPAR